MDDSSDPVQQALAAYLEYLELGGSEPDTSHLSQQERERLDELIGALELTEGVAFGLGRSEESRGSAPPGGAAVDLAEPAQLLPARLRESLPPDVRIEEDRMPFVSELGGVGVVHGWLVGTFGGRVRVWLLDVETARELESNLECLAALGRVFAALPDTSGVALVARDLSCLVVEPEDCAPRISTPGGSLVGRRYRHPVRPVAVAVPDFLRRLVPYWDPIPAFERGSGVPIDLPALTRESAATAIEGQRGVGQRARKGNPKKDVLLALGDQEAAALAGWVDGVLGGSIDPSEIEQRIERLAKER